MNFQINQGKKIAVVSENISILGFDTYEKLIRTNADYRKMYNLQKEAYV
ncbi:hypothetical protein H3U50_05630 [Lactobacillus sp. M0398]|nr:hypothetical protein [Lactobacillus sp. M0398]MBI0121302.1 hypothetical protein [Lactobacillus sp. M0398]